MAKWIVLNCPAAESAAVSLRTLFALILLYLLLFPCWINPFLYSVHHFPTSAFFFSVCNPTHRNASQKLIPSLFPHQNILYNYCFSYSQSLHGQDFLFLASHLRPIFSSFSNAPTFSYTIPFLTFTLALFPLFLSPSQPILCIPHPNISHLFSFASVV